MSKFILPILLAGAVAVADGTAAEAATISTLASENSTIQFWGLPDTAAYGQTFTMAAAALLNGITFRINDSGSAISYAAQVFAWDGAKTTGAALFSSTGATSGSGVMESVSVNTGATGLGAGQYVAFLQATSNGAALWGSVSGSSVYDGGAFVFQNNGGNTGLWGTVNWDTNGQGAGSDLAFALDYTVATVPLPAGLVLLLGALGSLAALRRRQAAA